jgi:hypothetical protein
MKADPPPANPVISTSSVLKILTMPLAEVLFFKKAIKGVIKFFLSKIAAFILKKVTLTPPHLASVVQGQ